MKYRVIAIILISTLLSACAGAPIYNSFKSPEEMKSVSTEHLCNGIYTIYPEKFRNELKRRNAFTESEWTRIDQKKISIGMRKEAVYCSWGKAGAIRPVENDSKIDEMWVYSQGRLGQRVYFSGNFVVDVQRTYGRRQQKCKPGDNTCYAGGPTAKQ